MVANATVNGEQLTVGGVYALVGDELSFEVQLPGGVFREKFKLTKLTNDELEGRNPAGQKEVFKRVKPKPDK